MVDNQCDITTNNSCNIGSTEANIRISLSFIVLAVAMNMQCYLLMFFSMALAYTGFKKHCFLYAVFKINEKFSLKNYYMAHLPKYNPSAVFMFDKKGKVFFNNQSAKESFSHINSFDDFNLGNMDEIKNEDFTSTRYYEVNHKHYQLDIKGISKIDSVLVYATDISKMVELNDEIENTQKEIIYTMGEIGETRSKETGNHVKRVAKYSYVLAKLYGLSEEEAKTLQMASPMHDIGKVAIADEILNKPAKLTQDEFKIMKTHAAIGYEMLKKSQRPIIKAAAIVAKEHHEKYDGSGYPQGLQGDKIHIYGRITAVADVFDALGSERVYKKAWNLDDILEFFQDQKGKHFDPELIDLFFKNIDQFLAIKDQYRDV